jgi:hypothetical protein
LHTRDQQIAMVVSTRNVMLPAHVRGKLGRRSGAPGLHVLVSAADPSVASAESLTFPFQINCESLIQAAAGSWPRRLAYSSVAPAVPA